MWYKALYVNEDVSQKVKDRWIKKINKNKIIKDVLCLCLTNKENYEMEILSTRELRRERARSISIRIIGLAKGREDALDLTRKIVQDIYDETKTVGIKKYFMNGDFDEEQVG